MRASLLVLLITLIATNFLVSSDEQKDKSEVIENLEKIKDSTLEENDSGNELNQDDKAKTFPRKLLARRREEHLQLLQGIAANPNYEWRFKLVELGVTKVLDLIHENKNLEMKGGVDDKMTEYKILILENSCLLMDFIVNFNYNEDIYVILRKIGKKGNFNWQDSVKFVIEYLEREIDMLDELTTKEFEFVKVNLEALLSGKVLPDYPLENSIIRDINMAERIYLNEKQMHEELKNKGDKKKRAKKGPSLQLPPLRASKTEL